MNKNKRRNVLKGLALGAPVVWVKPVIEAVILPVHAQTSIAVVSTFAGPFSTEPGDGGGIAIITDTVDSSVSVDFNDDPDSMIFIDSDPLETLPSTEFVFGENDNWVEQPLELDVPAGTYTREVVRLNPPNAGLTYRVTFTFTASSGPDGVVTVSDITIEGPV